MIPKKMRFAVAMWHADTPGDPSLVVDMEISQPGAKALEAALAGLSPGSEASQIKQAFVQGFNQVDAISVIPTREKPPQAPRNVRKSK